MDYESVLKQLFPLSHDGYHGFDQQHEGSIYGCPKCCKAKELLGDEAYKEFTESLK